jgi:hypothetical protein
MLPRPVAKYHICPAILLLSTQDDLAPPATPQKGKKSKRKSQQPDEPHTPPKTPEQSKVEPIMSDKAKEYGVPHHSTFLADSS